MATLQDPTHWLHSIDYTVPTKTMGFLRHNLALARHTTESCIQNIGLPSAEVCSTCFETLSQTSDAARWTCRRLRNKRSVGDMLDELEWPSLEAHREQSPLTFFYKIHSDTVSLVKDKYLTPSPNLGRTMNHSTTLDTLLIVMPWRIPSFSGLFPLWNRPPSSVVSSKITEEFKGLI